MTGSDIVQQIQAQRTAKHCIVKWWQQENDLVEFELIDRFIQQVKPADRIDGFQLLDLEKMWEVLTGYYPDNLKREVKGDGEVIEWVWSGKDGTTKMTVYPFTPQGFMTIINDEFFA